MLKSFFGLLAASFLLASCAAPPQSAATQSTSSTAVASTSTRTGERRQAVWVDPPTGSHVGGGFVRTGRGLASNDEPGLINAIDTINRAETSQRERPFAISAVSVVSGMSEGQLLALQHQTNLRLGELLAFNTIAQNRSSKVPELASLRSQGKSWSDLSRANGVNIAAVAQRVRRASDLTVESYMTGLEKQGAPTIIRGLGRAPQGAPPGTTTPSG